MSWTKKKWQKGDGWPLKDDDSKRNNLTAKRRKSGLPRRRIDSLPNDARNSEKKS
jgi:hypothetical protein